MSLLLCRPEPVKHPYYIEALGIHIGSSQELCYVIIHNPMLVLEDFVTRDLTDFIRQDLNLPVLAQKLGILMESQAKSEELLYLILGECDYCTEAQRTEFKQKITALRKLHPARFDKERADELFAKKQFGKAEAMYAKILDYPRDETVNDEFIGAIQHNLGAVYAQMFQFARAFRYMDQAYRTCGKEQILKEIYFLTVFDPDIPVKEEYHKLIQAADKEAWDQEIGAARQNALADAQVGKIRALFKKEGSGRMEEAARMIGNWKQEYRLMI